MTTATRSRPRNPALGQGELHQALEASQKLAALQGLCERLGCTPEEVSADGKAPDFLRMLDLMRTRGYTVAAPRRPQFQPTKGFTTWLVNVTTPAGIEFDLAFCRANDA